MANASLATTSPRYARRRRRNAVYKTLAWIATGFGWHANLWALLAFAAGAALCGIAIGRIEHKISA